MTRHEAHVLQTALADLEKAHAQIAEAKVRGLLTAAEREFAVEDQHGGWSELADEPTWEQVA